MTAMSASWPLFNGSRFPCESPLLAPIDVNTTFTEALTPCMALVLLPGIVSTFALSCLAFLVLYGWLVFAPALKKTRLVFVKAVLSALAVSAALVRLALTREDELFGAPEPVLARLFAVIIALICFLAYLRCWQRGIVSAIWLLSVWFIRLLTLALEYIYVTNSPEPKFGELCAIAVETFLAFFLVICFLFCDYHKDAYVTIISRKEVCPERLSSPLTRLTFKCANEIIAIGSKGTLSIDSFWALDPRYQPEALYPLFERALPPQEKRGKSLIPWLLVTLVKANLFASSAAYVLIVVFCVSVMLDPFALKMILDSLANGCPLWFTLGLIVLMFCYMMARFLMLARTDMYGMYGFMNIESMLSLAIYKKLLRLSAPAKVRYSVGEVVNLLSTDVDRIRFLWFNCLDLLYAPFMITFSISGLYFIIGRNVFYGVVVLVLFTPINSLFVWKATGYQKEQMNCKDERLKLMSDILSGMKIIKFYAWENSMRNRAGAVRKKEMLQCRNAAIYNAFCEGTFSMCPIIAVIVSFAGYLFIDKQSLTPQVAFVSLMLFNLMRYSIYRVPGLVQELVNARISLIRLQDFLNEDEIAPVVNNLQPSTPSAVVELKDAAFTWDKNSELPPTIRNLNFTLQRGELVGVIGRVGTGKSSLLSAVCGELQLASGGFFRAAPLSLAYVPQEHWIQNMTFRDNVLFGRAFDEVYYRRTLDACALREDLRLFVAGDATEIGERGLNLSGGQKARVALARAVYQRADLYVLDDTLSAVDSHVGAHIFEHVIGSEGLLGRTTRLFALNSLSYLSRCDRILVLQEGEIVDAGTYPELCARKHDAFVELVRELATRQESVVNEGDEEGAPAEVDDVLRELIGSPSSTSASVVVGSVRRRTTSSTGEAPAFTRQFSNMSTHSHTMTHPAPPNLGDGRLVEDEDMVSENANWGHFIAYVSAFGWPLFFTYLFVMFGVRTTLESASQVWVSRWSSGFSNSSNISDSKALLVYGALGCSFSVLVGLCYVIIAVGAYSASKKLHDNLLFSLLRSPMGFFDRTPLGRILNRLSKDIDNIDRQLPEIVAFIFVLVAEVLQNFGSAVYVLPWLALFIIPMLVIFVAIVRYFTRTSCQVRRIVSKTWSNVASQVQESYSGVSVIRAFENNQRFTERMTDCNRASAESNQAMIMTNRWIAVRMDFLTAIMTLVFSSAAVILGHWGWLNTGAVALVVSTGTMLRGLLGEIGRLYKNVEMNIVAVERVQEYIENEPEAEWEGEERAPPDWPTRGEIRFEDVSLRYRPTTPLVLHNLNVTIAAGQKVGIVGRTGAGKSSLTLALFRLVEPAGGRILIDGLDCGRLGLHEVRRALTIIPQDPVLFCGDLRANLDPFEELSDADLWQAVERAHLLPFVQQFPNGLRHEIGEGGSNLSVGQRQLVCLARAILRRDTRILVLDEATAAVDLETDRLIQRAIRNEFVHATVLTIAHRLDTILDYDRVLVLEAGEVREFDTPQTLLRNPEGLFHSLAKQAKLV